LAVSGKSANRAWFEAVCDRNVSSTVKPSFARCSAGWSTCPSDRLPQARSAPSQVAAVPGAPTLRPLVTASSNGSGFPFSSRNRPGPADAGAVSRPSIVWTVRDFAS
jgi:hypothetical protein